MLDNLNAEQMKVVLADEHKILCLAGAGAGKTHTMIARIIHQLSNGVDPESILVLTFTNNAAFEMRQRYLKYAPSSLRSIPEFRTFHSFCYSLLMQDGAILRHLGYTAVPNIADDSMCKELLTTAAMQCGVKMSERKLMAHETLSIAEEANRKIVLKAYERLMKQKNLITFDRLCYGVCELFSNDSELSAKYKQQYKYIYADEFQDTDKRQMAFISSFTASDLFVCGDALQAIYSFRGADSFIIKNIATDASWTTYRITHNYRSTKDIVEFANTFSKSYADDNYRITMKTDRPGQPVVVNKGFMPTRRGQIGLLDKISEVVVQHHIANDGSIAVLCRTNAEVAVIIDQLASQHIPVTSGGSSSYYCAVLKCVLDDKYFIELAASKLSGAEYATYIRQTFAGSLTISQFATMFNHNSEVAALIRDVSQIRLICSEYTTMMSRCVAILEYVKCDATTADFNDATCNTFESLIEYVITKLQTQVESAIYVGTIHSAKGLEYDTVILPGVNDTSFPLNNEDNCNLYYVGITRAKSNLYIFKW